MTSYNTQPTMDNREHVKSNPTSYTPTIQHTNNTTQTYKQRIKNKNRNQKYKNYILIT